MKKTIKIKIQNLYSNTFDDKWQTFEILGDLVIGMSNSRPFEIDSEFKTKKPVHIDLHNLWIKSVYNDEYNNHNNQNTQQLIYACSDYFKINETEFIGCIKNVYEIEYDGKILSFNEINNYFKEYFSDKLIIHEKYQFGIISIVKFVSLSEYQSDIIAFHMALRDLFNTGKNMFTCLYQNFNFDAIFKDRYGNDNFSYNAKITNDKSVLAFFNDRINKLFNKLLVK